MSPWNRLLEENRISADSVRRLTVRPPIEEAVTPDEFVSRFLIAEADLLDTRRFEEWLTLLHSDIRYFAPVQLQLSDDNLTAATDVELGHFDENLTSLRARIKRIRSGSAWSEDPAPRTRRFVSNIHILSASAECIIARSNLLLYRLNIVNTAPEVWACQRGDTIVNDADSWKLRERMISLDATVLPYMATPDFL